MLEQVAEELADWIDRMAQEVAAGMMQDGRSPFGAQMTEQEKLEYYAQQLFNPDGSPNVEGRQKLIERVGVDGFVRILNAVMKGRGQPALPGLPTPPEPETPPMVERPEAGFEEPETREEQVKDLRGAQDPFVYLIHHIHHVASRGTGSVTEELHHCPLFVSKREDAKAYHVDDIRDGNRVLHILIGVPEGETPPDTLYDHLGNAYNIVRDTVQARTVWVVTGLKKGKKVKWSDAEA